MAMRRLGRAWGNALGGWRAQPRMAQGRFGRKGAGAIAGGKSNYRPSRNQVAKQNQQQAIAKRAKAERNTQRLKTAAVVGGIALAAGGAYYGLKKTGNAQANLYDTRQGAKFVRNAAKYNRSTGPGATVSQATRIKAGSFPTVASAARQSSAVSGFSNAAKASHNISKLSPPVSFETNTRRPAMYRYAGDALKNVQKVDMGGKELIPKRDMTRELRSMNMRKTNWKKKAKTAAEAAKQAKAAKPAKAAPTKQQKKAAVQNPKAASTPAAKIDPPKVPAKPKAKSAPKSKNVQAPKAAVTVAESAPAQPAVGTGSKKTKASPAKQAATGGNKPKSNQADAALPQDFYENNPAPLGDDDDVRIVGGKIQGIDQFGEEVIIPIAGRRSINPRSNKPVGVRPGGPVKPKANNQPRPVETVQKEASKAASLDSSNGSTTITAASLLRPKNAVKPSDAWFAKRFDVAEVARVAKDPMMDAPKIKAAFVNVGGSKADADLFAKAVRDLRKAEKRARGRGLDGKKVSAAEHKAASLAGDMVTKTMSESQRIAAMSDKMASGKMTGPSEGEIRNAMDVLKGLAGMQNYTASMLWEEATGRNKTLYTIEERKAMRMISNYKNLKLNPRG